MGKACAKMSIYTKSAILSSCDHVGREVVRKSCDPSKIMTSYSICIRAVVNGGEKLVRMWFSFKAASAWEVLAAICTWISWRKAYFSKHGWNTTKWNCKILINILQSLLTRLCGSLRHGPAWRRTQQPLLDPWADINTWYYSTKNAKIAFTRSGMHSVP